MLFHIIIGDFFIFVLIKICSLTVLHVYVVHADCSSPLPIVTLSTPDDSLHISFSHSSPHFVWSLVDSVVGRQLKMSPPFPESVSVNSKE